MRRATDSIIEGCKDENRNAQAALYKQYAPKLYAVCLRYCAQKSDAEDCLHDAFMKIYDQVKHYKGKGSFEGWLRRITVNVCIDMYRKQKFVFNDKDIEIAEKEEALDWERYDAKQVISALEHLSPQYRAVFNLYAVENLSHKEIAEEFEISESTSRSNYLRARKKLQEVLTNKEVNI